MINVELYIYVDNVTDVSNILISNFTTRVTEDGGNFEAGNCLRTNLQSLGGYTGTSLEAKRIELFSDEKISVTSSIQNVNDIGKVFTDVSKSFTIPASKVNNKILSHWYESSVDGGYDHRKRYNGYIEIDTQRFRDGNIQLEKANKKNGFIESYTVTFYGNLTQLKDKFKDEKLSTLDFTGLNHTYNSSNIISRINPSLSYLVSYPLIGSERKFYYKESSSAQDINNTLGAIKWDSLFPAVPLWKISELIQQKYGIVFTGSFFNLDQWNKLNLYFKNSEALVVQTEIMRLVPTTIATGSFPELNNGIITTNWNFASGSLSASLIKIQLTVIPTDLTLDYTLYIYKNNVLYKTFKKEDRVTSSGGDAYQIDLYSRSTDPSNNVYEFKITSLGANSFKSSFWYWRYNNRAIASFTRADTTVAQVTTSKINIVNYVPEITINDFIIGIIKAFNLMIIPKDLNTYEFIPLEMYYNAGKVTDITKYVYSEEMEIEKPKLYKSINFQYEKSPNILNNKFKGLYGTEYGDLNYTPTSSNESATYDVKLPFENILFERTVGYQFETATLWDKDFKPYTPKPLLIYNNGTLPTNLITADVIYITTESTVSSVNNYVRFSNEYNSIPSDTTYFSGLMTMNFSNEQSPWENVLAPQGLYYRHYKNYIDNLYNIKTRIIKVKALLPPSLMTSNVLKVKEKAGISLNDRLIIRNKRYIINTFTTDLTTGEADFELITDYRGVNAVNSVGYKFANYSDIQIDSNGFETDVVIYLNDYDSFIIKPAVDFLIYTVTGLHETGDVVLPVSADKYSGSIEKTDEIEIEYYKNGLLEITEYITVIQTAI